MIVGIDISGGMIIGAAGDDIAEPSDFDGDFIDWIEENGMDGFAEYYDADQGDTYYGFTVTDILVDELDGGWLADVKSKAKKFEDLTGVKAMLIGTQNVW